MIQADISESGRAVRAARSAVRRIVLPLAAAIALLVPTLAFAGHVATGVPEYTGCLTTASGIVVGLAVGPNPKSPCQAGQVQVHLSGGDITAVNVGTGANEGLVGGGTNGAVTIGISPSYRLPQGCKAGTVPKITATLWTCALDNDTTYGGADFAVSDQKCSFGQFANVINENGGLDCATPRSNPKVEAEATSKQVPAVDDEPGLPVMIRIRLPFGYWHVSSEIVIRNETNFALQDNSREVACALYLDGEPPGPEWFSKERIDGIGVTTVPNMRIVGQDQGFGNWINLGCQVSGTEEEAQFITAESRRIIATQVNQDTIPFPPPPPPN